MTFLGNISEANAKQFTTTKYKGNPQINVIHMISKISREEIVWHCWEFSITIMKYLVYCLTKRTFAVKLHWLAGCCPWWINALLWVLEGILSRNSRDPVVEWDIFSHIQISRENYYSILLSIESPKDIPTRFYFPKRWTLLISTTLETESSTHKVLGDFQNLSCY